MSATTPVAGSPLTVSAVLAAARGVLRGDWMTLPTYDMTGILHSHRGHCLHFQGIQDGRVFAVGLLDDGTRREVSAPATAHTAAAYGKALADLVRTELEPAHDAVSSTRVIIRKVRATAPPQARTEWRYGECHTFWWLAGHGSAQHTTRTVFPGDRGSGAQADSLRPRAARHGDLIRRPWNGHRDGTASRAISRVEFADLTVEQAIVILRAIRTDNRDPRRHEPVLGPLARQMRAAAPGLRPGGTYRHWHGSDPVTVTLSVDGVVDVELSPLREGAPVTLTVHGSMDNQLRAVDASV